VTRPTVLLKRSLIFVHRWLGVALSVIFMIWFVSGIVMMYWSFPGVTARDRLERAMRLDAAQIRVSPEQAAATLGREATPAAIRLTSLDGRPVYRIAGGGGGRGGGRGRGAGAIVFADDGAQPAAVDSATIDRAAANWARRPLREANREAVEEVDQWTVAGALRNLRPLYKYSWPDGQQVYVDGTTANVVQHTTTSSRFWAYLGAIPHWLYFTPLRKHQQQWFSFVVYSSLIGTISALIGVVVAIWMYSPRKRYRHGGLPTSIPYKGWKRWHTIAGLFFGVVTTTWAFSGLLSMGPFPIMNQLTDLTVPPPPAPADSAGAAAGEGAARGRGRGGGPNLAAALRGGRGGPPMSAYSGRSPADAIAAVADFDVRELEYTAFAGTPLYLATNPQGETRLIPMQGSPMTALDAAAVMSVVRQALGPNVAELRLIDQYDAYYRDRTRQRPLPVIFARLNDSVGTRYYVDPKTATVVQQYSARGWVSRWLYNGLHSLDFPWLYNYRPLWDIVVITLMLGGTALCVTSLVMTYRVLARKAVAFARARFEVPDEDLAIENR
jgi:PepSY-associated transmembrane protein